jgi:hypothetical protein
MPRQERSRRLLYEMREGIAASIEQEVAGWSGVTVEPHRFGGVEFRVGLPASGWVSVQIRGAQDVETVVELFRLNYERPWRGGPR